MAKDLYIKAKASASAVWGAITGTLADQLDLVAALAAKQDTLVSGTNIKTVNSTSLVGSGNVAVEPTITAGTTSQYWRGDKSWQTLDKTAVGLGNVDNTSDANKPISTATQTALDAKGYVLATNLNGGTIAIGTTYVGFGVGSTNTTESTRRTAVMASTYRYFAVRILASMTGSCTITVMKNGVATSMAITIAAGSAAGLYSTTSNQFSVVDGDEISIRFVQTTATSTGFYNVNLIAK